VTDPIQRPQLRNTATHRGAIGHSAAFVRVLHQAARLAQLDVPVLITSDGRSGCGKSTLARLIHENSERRAGPFVEFNCAAIPPALLDRELFGFRDWLDEKSPNNGRVAAAAGGTLVLDEFPEIPWLLQQGMFRLVKSQRYAPAGETRTHRADVRVIAATCRDVTPAVEHQELCGDLVSVFGTAHIRMPWLEQRREDIPDLAEHFCALSCKMLKVPPIRLSREAVHALEAYEWIGEIRQLEHTVDAAVIRAIGARAAEVEVKHLLLAM